MSNGINRETRSTSAEMDARTLLHTINTGALSQFKIFSEKIRSMGRDKGLNLELVSLNNGSIIYEDLDKNVYYQASVERVKGGKIKIDNVKEIKIVESQKSTTFKKSCSELVDAISEDKKEDVESIWNKISRQHFSSRTIPSSGMVITRDGVARKVNIDGSTLPEDIKPLIVKAICEALSDRVSINNEKQIIEATLNDGEKFVLPITELTRRKVVARYMKEAATKAYMSEGFQKVMKSVAGMISHDRISDAVKSAAKFLKEEQEFSLLSRDECVVLAENSLAAVGCLNDSLAEDLGTLIYRVNCKVNKNEIVESWKQTARKAAYAPFVENVRLLEESKDFDNAYSDFLKMIFIEDKSSKAIRADAYLARLKDIRKVVETSEKDQTVLSAIDNLVSKLENVGDEIDDATLYEVEDLLASVSQELVQDVQNLADFDEIPEVDEEPAKEFGVPEGEEAVEEPELDMEFGKPETGASAATPAATSAAAPASVPSPESELLAAGVERDGIPISETTKDQLAEELATWAKNYLVIVSENGRNSCIELLKECVARAKELKEDALVNGFNKHLSELMLVSEKVGQDPYSFEIDDVDINPDYETIEEDADAGMVAADGKGVQPKKAGEIDTGSGKKQKMDQDGKGIAKKSVKEERDAEMVKADGKGVANKKAADIGNPGGTKDEIIKTGGKGLAGEVKDSDGSSGSEAGSGSSEKMVATGGEGVACKKVHKTDAKSGDAAQAADLKEEEEKKVEEKKDEKKDEELEEDQYKGATKRRGMGLKRGAVNPMEDLDAAIDAIAEELGDVDGEEEKVEEADLDDLEEGKLPPWLEKFKFKGKGKKDEKPEGKAEEKPEEKKEEVGVEEKKEDKGAIAEDDDVTQPDSKKYDSADAARKDGSGKMARKLPKIAATDYEGTKGQKNPKGVSHGEGGEKLPGT